MRLRHLSISDFRNINYVKIEPDKRFNLVYGLNGQGKTNLLEAIYLLGSPRSFRTSRLLDFVRHNQQKVQIQGNTVSGGSENSILLTIEAAGRKVEIDGKSLYKASELHGKLNAVIFSPDDTGMIKLGPESRRRYLDRAVYMSDICYLHCWHAYHRILKQRNYLLKNSDKTGLDIWTIKLAESGAEIIERRLNFVTMLTGKLRKHYTTIAGNSEIASMSYHPNGVESKEREQIAQELLNLFKRQQHYDERCGTTSVGPHRDDLTFVLDGRLLKSFSSQGQQKSYILALKMAEIDNLHETFGETPLLLLDDMSSELDARRNCNLIEFLTTEDIQVFITTTERSPDLLAVAPQCAVFHVENGNLTLEGS